MCHRRGRRYRAAQRPLPGASATFLTYPARMPRDTRLSYYLSFSPPSYVLAHRFFVPAVPRLPLRLGPVRVLPRSLRPPQRLLRAPRPHPSGLGRNAVRVHRADARLGPAVAGTRQLRRCRPRRACRLCLRAGAGRQALSQPKLDSDRSCSAFRRIPADGVGRPCRKRSGGAARQRLRLPLPAVPAAHPRLRRCRARRRIPRFWLCCLPAPGRSCGSWEPASC